MKLSIRRLASLILLLTLGLTYAIHVPAYTAFANPNNCTDPQKYPENLIRDGSIDGGYSTQYGVVANGWSPFIMQGNPPQYDVVDNENANGDYVAPYAQFYHAENSQFDAGIYQVIHGTQPGASYEFSVGDAMARRDVPPRTNTVVNDIGRQVGVDPNGGSDPHGATIVWGPMRWSGTGALNLSEMDLVFVAQSNTVTVFIRATNRNPGVSDKVWLDVICLMPRQDIPISNIQATASPTSTPLPPSRTPAPQKIALAARNTAVPTTLPTETALPTETMIPPTRTTSPTLVPTGTPKPRRAIPLASAGLTGMGGTADNSSEGASLRSMALVVGSVGAIGSAMMVIVLLAGFFFWRLTRNSPTHGSRYPNRLPPRPRAPIGIMKMSIDPRARPEDGK